jgi:LSD1 subclass zinc finger protein
LLAVVEPFSVARRGRRAPARSSRPASPCCGLSSSLRTRSSLFLCLPRARKFSARNGVSSFRVELLSCVPVVVSEPILSCRSIFSYPAASVVVKCVCCRELAPGAHSVFGPRFLQLGQAGHRSVLCTRSFLLASASSRLAWP